MATYDLLKGLPLTIESYSLEGYELKFSPEFTRLTTEFRLEGGGETGVGEDVIYGGLDHIALRDRGPVLDLAGEHTLGSLAERLDGLDLFPDPPEREDSRNYRRWAIESAALDLALRQAGRSLGDVLGREPKPLHYVVSMRLGGLEPKQPETSARLVDVLDRYPG
ncbi:MAG: hypothetical protein H0V50_05555, partial [Thermoleophilaceae bacterium]|nr:hypothetical protein [Thermoleophilaceae bacterium]